MNNDTDWHQVAAGERFSVAVKDDGSLWHWGRTSPVNDTLRNLFMGIGGIPSAIGSARDWFSAAAGTDHACAVTESGALYCWGNNEDGQLGSGSAGGVTPEPAEVEVGQGVRSVAAGEAFTCAIADSGALYCWGDNQDGQLGISGVETLVDTPTQVGAASDWAAVSLGTYHSCGLNQQSQLFCWGRNAEGQLGLDDPAKRPAPEQVGSDADWFQLSTGALHTCAIKASGSLYCWGSNSAGQIAADAETGGLNTPTQVGQDTDWYQVTCGPEHTCALKGPMAACTAGAAVTLECSALAPTPSNTSRCNSPSSTAGPLSPRATVTTVHSQPQALSPAGVTTE